MWLPILFASGNIISYLYFIFADPTKGTKPGDG